MRTLDVRIGDKVVIYDCRKGWFACRASFVLKTFGFKDVSVLDGGMKKWVSEEKPTESNSRGAAKAEDFVFTKNNDLVASFEQVKKISDEGQASEF